MDAFLAMTPRVRFAAQYRYSGTPPESARRGDCYALHLFTQNEGHLAVDGIRYPVANGTLLFIRPGQLHSFHFTPEHSAHAYNIYFDLWAAEADGASYPQFAFDSQPMPRLTPQRPCEPIDAFPTSAKLANPSLEELFAQIHRVYDEPMEARLRDAMTGTLLAAWLFQWHRHLSRSGPRNPRIARLLEEMDNAAADSPLSYDEMCRRCGLGKSYFYELFKQETGMTPKQYALRARMKKAGSMLVESRLTVTSIAEALGYDSVHYFSKQFASFHGMPPTAFRSRASGR